MEIRFQKDRDELEIQKNKLLAAIEVSTSMYVERFVDNDAGFFGIGNTRLMYQHVSTNLFLMFHL